MSEEPSVPPRDLEAAIRRHFDERMKMAEYHHKQIDTFSLAAIRAPAIVAAGAIFAQLGFYSANRDTLTQAADKLLAFNNSLFWLVLSLFFTVLAPGAAYFSQISYMRSIYAHEISDDRTTHHEGRWSRIHRYIGDGWRYASIALTIAAIISLAVGGFYFLRLTA